MTAPATEILAANVRALIERVGSGSELARLTGLPQKTISRIANGENAVTLDTLNALAEGTGLHPWQLLVRYDTRALFNQAVGFQDGTRIRFTFETESDADDAFEFIGELGDMPSNQISARRSNMTHEIKIHDNDIKMSTPTEIAGRMLGGRDINCRIRALELAQNHNICGPTQSAEEVVKVAEIYFRFITAL